MTSLRTRSNRKPDLFSLALVLVALGAAVTLLYQINLYYGAGEIPIARRAPAAAADGPVDG